MTLKSSSTRQDAGPVETLYQTYYGHTSQHQATIVRSDGSATAQYPAEGVAVSVDPEVTGTSTTLNLVHATSLPGVLVSFNACCVIWCILSKGLNLRPMLWLQMPFWLMLMKRLSKHKFKKPQLLCRPFECTDVTGAGSFCYLNVPTSVAVHTCLQCCLQSPG